MDLHLTRPCNDDDVFYNVQAAGGGGTAPVEALGRPEYSLGKLDNFGVAPDDVVVSSAAPVDMGPPGFEMVPLPAGPSDPPPVEAPARARPPARWWKNESGGGLSGLEGEREIGGGEREISIRVWLGHEFLMGWTH